MSKQLKDILLDFTTMSAEAQEAKVAEIRRIRSIERPSTVKKKEKKRVKKVESGKKDFAKILESMSEKERDALFAKFGNLDTDDSD